MCQQPPKKSRAELGTKISKSRLEQQLPWSPRPMLGAKACIDEHGGSLPSERLKAKLGAEVAMTNSKSQRSLWQRSY